MATILDGKVVQEKIAKDLMAKISGLDPKPKLVIIQIGNVPESTVYIGRKIKFGEKIGALVEHVKFPNDVTQKDVVKKIEDLNHDDFVHGIIVQLPIPSTLFKNQIIEAISPLKDVDGLTSTNIKMLWEEDTLGHVPATTKGMLTLLSFYKIAVNGKKVVVIGRSSLVGKPTAIYFLNNNATVSVCHSKTTNLVAETKSADIIISAVGKPGLITKDHVKKGQVIIDVGTTVEDGKLKGDVDYENVKDIVSAISPVPGGIGPLTVASLFQNLLDAYASLND